MNPPRPPENGHRLRLKILLQTILPGMKNALPMSVSITGCVPAALDSHEGPKTCAAFYGDPSFPAIIDKWPILWV
jgi:hypothetical protein